MNPYIDLLLEGSTNSASEEIAPRDGSPSRRDSTSELPSRWLFEPSGL